MSKPKRYYNLSDLEEFSYTNFTQLSPHNTSNITQEQFYNELTSPHIVAKHFSVTSINCSDVIEGFNMTLAVLQPNEDPTNLILIFMSPHTNKVLLVNREVLTILDSVNSKFRIDTKALYSKSIQTGENKRTLPLRKSTYMSYFLDEPYSFLQYLDHYQDALPQECKTSILNLIKVSLAINN